MSVTNLAYFMAYQAELSMSEVFSPMRYRGRKLGDPKCSLCDAEPGSCCQMIFMAGQPFERGHPVPLEAPFSGPLYQSPEDVAELASFADDPFLKELRERHSLTTRAG